MNDEDLASDLAGQKRCRDIERRELWKIKLCAAFLLIGVSAFNVKSFLEMQQTVTAGKVAFSSVREVNTRRSHYFAVDVRYVYEVAKKTLTGWDSVGRFATKEEAQRASSKIASGTSWAVHYDRKHPDAANSSPCMVVAGIVLPFLFAMMCLFPGLLKYKRF